MAAVDAAAHLGAERQQKSAPSVDSTLLGKRLEICCNYDLLPPLVGKEPRWCAGEVVLISDGTNIAIPDRPRAKYPKGEAVMMRWDADVAREEPVTTSSARLLVTKWNPKGEQTDGGWRFDPDCL